MLDACQHRRVGVYMVERRTLVHQVRETPCARFLMHFQSRAGALRLA